MDKQVLARWIAGLERNGFRFSIDGGELHIEYTRAGSNPLSKETIALLRHFEGQIREHLAGEQAPAPAPELREDRGDKGQKGQEELPIPCAQLCPCSRCQELRGEKTPPPTRPKPGLYRRVRSHAL